MRGLATIGHVAADIGVIREKGCGRRICSVHVLVRPGYYSEPRRIGLRDKRATLGGVSAGVGALVAGVLTPVGALVAGVLTLVAGVGPVVIRGIAGGAVIAASERGEGRNQDDGK